MQRASLKDAYLVNANLNGASLLLADLTGASLRRAKLTAADLSGVTGLTREQIAEALMDERTQLPVSLR